MHHLVPWPPSLIQSSSPSLALLQPRGLPPPAISSARGSLTPAVLPQSGQLSLPLCKFNPHVSDSSHLWREDFLQMSRSDTPPSSILSS